MAAKLTQRYGRLDPDPAPIRSFPLQRSRCHADCQQASGIRAVGSHGWRDRRDWQHERRTKLQFSVVPPPRFRANPLRLAVDLKGTVYFMSGLYLGGTATRFTPRPLADFFAKTASGQTDVERRVRETRASRTASER